MRDLLRRPLVRQGANPRITRAGVYKKLFGVVLGGFLRISRTPQLEAAIKAVNLAEALAHQISRSALTGVAVVASNDQGGIQIGVGDEVVQRVVIQVLRAADMAGSERLRVAYVDYHGALFA